MTLYFFRGRRRRKKQNPGGRSAGFCFFFRLRERDRSASDFFCSGGDFIRRSRQKKICEPS